MSVDAIAIAGPPPASTGPATTSAGGAPPADGDFASIIAAAMAPSGVVETPLMGGPVPRFGLELLTQLGPSATPPPEIDAPWLDRDAGAELAAEAAGAAMLAALLSMPQQVITPPATPGAPLTATVTPELLGGVASEAPGAVMPELPHGVVLGRAPEALGSVAPELMQHMAPGVVPGSTPDPAPEATMPLASPALLTPVSGRDDQHLETGIVAAAADAPALATVVTTAVQSPPAQQAAGGAVATAFAPSRDSASADVADVDATDGEAIGVSSTPGGSIETALTAGDAAGRPPLGDDGRDARDEGAAQGPARIEASTPQLAVNAVPANDRPAVAVAPGRVDAPLPIVEAPDGPRLASNLAETVGRATLNGDHDLTLALNPPDLGQLTVHVTEHADGGVSISIQASSSEARDLLQQHLSALRTGLEQREVRVEQLRVEQQSAAASLGWQGSGQRQSRGEQGENDQPEWSPLASMQRVESVGGVRPAVQSERVGSVDVRA